MRGISRRAFLCLPVAALWASRRAGAQGAQSETASRRATYVARVDLLWGALRFELAGAIHEAVDRDAGRYEVRLAGQGSGIANEVDSAGVLRDGRWAPVRTRSRFVVHGRQSHLDVAYDHDRRTVEYRSRQETFFLRRLRVTDDTVAVPAGMHVDDVVSATVNHAEGRWGPGPDGTLLTHVVRRRRGPREGPDDVESAYRAELVPFVLRVAEDRETGKPAALFDLTRFSSWAREGEPARVVFGPDRRPELITASLMLGTSVTVRLAPAVAS